MNCNSAGLLNLLQLADSSFPTGAFAHSLGLESLVLDDCLGVGPAGAAEARESALASILAARLDHEMARCDVPVFLAAFELALAGDAEQLVHLDLLANSLRPVREWRESGCRAGRRMLAAAADFSQKPLLLELLEAEHVRYAGFQMCLSFAVTAAALGCDCSAAAHAYVFTFTSGQLAAAVRLGVVGQRGVQRILHQLKPRMRSAVQCAQTVPAESAGASLPLLELAGMSHELAPERLFIS